MNLGGRKERKNTWNPNLILYQAEVQPGLKKKATKFKYGLVQPHYILLFHSVGIPHVTHLHIWAQSVI